MSLKSPSRAVDWVQVGISFLSVLTLLLIFSDLRWLLGTGRILLMRIPLLLLLLMLCDALLFMLLEWERSMEDPKLSFIMEFNRGWGVAEAPIYWVTFLFSCLSLKKSRCWFPLQWKEKEKERELEINGSNEGGFLYMVLKEASGLVFTLRG